jgi:glycosyltransferase involved in cell wall biosynthesis
MYSLTLPTYNNPEYLKLCVDSILQNSYYKTHQLCIHINGYNQKSIDYLKNLNNKNIIYTISDNNIGLPKATNICIKNTIFDKIIFIADDLYFPINWDYNLHQWEIELNNKFPDYVHLISYKYCEPYKGSFLPPCEAGTDINNFDESKFNEHLKKYSVHDIQDWLSNSLYPKNILLKCPIQEDFEYNLSDIDYTLTVLKYFKDNNIKYLLFCAKDVCVYHFGSIASKKSLQRHVPDFTIVPKFENKWNMTVDSAYHKVLDPECKRSNKLVKDMLNDKLKIPKISTYISTWNPLFWNSTLEQTIRQALLFSDEIVIVNSEHSSDGTQNFLESLRLEYPDIIKLYTFKEDFRNGWNTVTEKKSFALSKCTGDWCILQDDDEMIHEKYVEYIKMLPIICPDTIAFRFNTIHFYRSFDHYQTKEGWYPQKVYMIKNGKGIKHGLVGTDPDNHILLTGEPVDSLPNPLIINTPITSYHYGWANRNDSVLLMKKYEQEIQWHGKDYWKMKNHKFPFKFEDPSKLAEFKDTHPKYMIPTIEQEKRFNTKRIKEFTE